MLQDLREFQIFKPTLVENDAKGSTYVEGLFQRADTLNANKRIYPRALWEKVLTNEGVLASMKGRRMFGELDHPADWRMTLGRAAHIITGLRMDESGNVIGRAEILDTPQGEVLKAIFKAGCEVGISSRGTGSTQRTNEGHEIVAEDFQLETFDFVATPSTPGAYPRMVMEAVERFQKPNDSAPVPEPLREFREVEREARELVATDVSESSMTVKNLLKSKLEENILRLAKLKKADAGVEEISGPVHRALHEKHEQVSAFGVPKEEGKERMAKPKIKEEDVTPSASADLDAEVPKTAVEDKDEAKEEAVNLDIETIFEGSSDDSGSSFSGSSKSKSSSSGSSSSSDEFSFDEGSGESDSGSGSDASSMDPMGMKSSGSMSSTMSGDMEDSETVSDAANMITANIPLKISVESLDRQITSFLKEEGEQVAFDATTTDTEKVGGTDEDASNDLPPAQSAGPDLVTKTEAEIKALATALAKNPAKLEAFLKYAVNVTNAKKVAEHNHKTTVRRFNKVAESMVRRYRTIKKGSGFVEAKYKLALEAISDLRDRHLTLRKKVIASENLRELPMTERKEWIETLAQAPTMADLATGIRRVKAAFKEKAEKPVEKPVTEEKVEKKTEKAEELPVRLSESRKERGSLGTSKGNLSEGVSLFRGIAAAKGLK